MFIFMSFILMIFSIKYVLFIMNLKCIITQTFLFSYLKRTMILLHKYIPNILYKVIKASLKFKKKNVLMNSYLNIFTLINKI